MLLRLTSVSCVWSLYFASVFCILIMLLWFIHVFCITYHWLMCMNAAVIFFRQVFISWWLHWWTGCFQNGCTFAQWPLLAFWWCWPLCLKSTPCSGLPCPFVVAQKTCLAYWAPPHLSSHKPYGVVKPFLSITWCKGSNSCKWTLPRLEVGSHSWNIPSEPQRLVTQSNSGVSCLHGCNACFRFAGKYTLQSDSKPSSGSHVPIQKQKLPWKVSNFNDDRCNFFFFFYPYLMNKPQAEWPPFFFSLNNIQPVEI